MRLMETHVGEPYPSYNLRSWNVDTGSIFEGSKEYRLQRLATYCDRLQKANSLQARVNGPIGDWIRR
jgi:hypothetical protein